MKRAAVVLMIMGAILAGCSSAPLRPSSIKGKGELWVQVLERESGEPLKEATVTLVEAYRSAETDSEGVAIITDIDPGTYSISISHSWLQTIREPDCEIRPDVVTELVYKMVSNDRLGE